MSGDEPATSTNRLSRNNGDDLNAGTSAGPTNLQKRKANHSVEFKEPPTKRQRRKPVRYEGRIGPQQTEEETILSELTRELRSWKEGSLKAWSDHLQWQRDAGSAQIAELVGKSPDAVDRLTDIIMKTEWKNVILSNSFGSGLLVNQKDDFSSERPLDMWFRRRCPAWKVEFWQQLCARLTPDSLNNSDQLADVMKAVAEKGADDEYGPIYEYLAIIMDDPASTVSLAPKLSGLQAGIVLEILHGIAMAVKETSKVQAVLRQRAVSVLTGDWASLKMPVREEETVSAAMTKKASLQSLNPFAMPRAALAKVRCRPPSQPDATAATVDGPLPDNLRSMSAMNQLRTGYTCMHVVHDEVPAPRYRKAVVHAASSEVPGQEKLPAKTFLDIKRELTEFLDKTRPDA